MDLIRYILCVKYLSSLSCFADEAVDRTPLGSWDFSSSHFYVTRSSGPQPCPALTYVCQTMGSVSSLINGNSLNSKHCKASEHRLKDRTSHHRKIGGCSLDGLLKCGFTQGSSSSTHPSKGLSHSRSGRSEDFFYIKVRFCFPTTCSVIFL